MTLSPPAAVRVQEPGIREQLLASLDPEFRKATGGQARWPQSARTLKPAAIVRSGLIQFERDREISWRSRAHLQALASDEVGRLLGLGGGNLKFRLKDVRLRLSMETVDAKDLIRNLGALAAEEPQMARVAGLRCIGGLTCEQVAHTVGIDEKTAKRDWQVAKAWLVGRLRKEVPGDSGAMGRN